ncbi:MAG: hypothetical protein ACPF9D_07700 [Owenweeksia sp.]
MGAGYGAIRAMQDSLKMNREQLKKHRKSAGELAKLYPLRNKKPFKYKKASPAEMELFKSELKARRKREDRQKAVLIIGLIIVGIAGISMLFI